MVALLGAFCDKGGDLQDDKAEFDSTASNEVQLLLAEKRTSLSVMRTGIAVLALPLSVISVLVATSRFYDDGHVLHFLIILGILNFTLIAFGTYLIIISVIRIKHYDHLIREIKLKYSAVGEFID